MSNLAEHLRKHLRGEVLDTKAALDYFATDGSVFTLKPRVIVYPRDLSDIRKVAKFCWQLAERGKKLPITARGKGTDQGGGALGPGVMMVMPTHMNKLLDLDRDTVTVQPGMLYGDLQRTLYSHGRFLPPYPSSIEFSTLGGAVANNACGEKTLKYGATADYVAELEVVLAEGQVIRTRPLSKRELNKKKGQRDFEGDIYRAIDGLLFDNAELIARAKPAVTKNSAGYALWDVHRPDGKFDLSRLIVGSQGTLGLVTEITFNTELYNSNPHMLTTFFDDLEKAGEAVMQLQKLKPSAMELVDQNLLQFLVEHNPSILEKVGIQKAALPAIVMLIEFDDEKRNVRNRKANKAHKLLAALAYERRIIPNHLEQDGDWDLRHSAAAVIWLNEGRKKALPIIEDGVVPIDKMSEFLSKVYALFKKYNLEIAVWGHAGNANFHMQPFLDLDATADRQTVFKLMDDFYRMVLEMGGSTCGEHNDGRLRAPYLKELYGEEIYELFREVKRIFDPHGILNPGVKLDVSLETNRKQLRREYSMKHLYDHMPQTH